MIGVGNQFQQNRPSPISSIMERGRAPAMPRKGPDDEPRALVRRIVKERGLKLNGVSVAAGLAPGFLSEFLNKNNPKELGEHQRFPLARVLDIPEEKLRGRKAMLAFSAHGSANTYGSERHPDSGRSSREREDTPVAEGELVPPESVPKQFLPALQALGKQGELWRLTNSRLTQAGYQNGDYVLISLDLTKRSIGCFVLAMARHDDSSIPIFRASYPPRLLTLLPTASQVEFEDESRITVRGVVLYRLGV